VVSLFYTDGLSYRDIARLLDVTETSVQGRLQRARARLREEIRALDLLARRAYFSRRWQIRMASLMLLGSVAVLVLSLKILNRGRQKLPDSNAEVSSWQTASLSRIGVIAAGAVDLDGELGLMNQASWDGLGVNCTEKSRPSHWRYESKTGNA